MKLVSDGRGSSRDAEQMPAIVAGTMVSADLELARKFYEGFLGMECVQHEPGRLLLRDRQSADLMRSGEGGGFVIDVREVDEVQHPQSMLNHWGFSVESHAEVDRIHDIALAEQEKYGLRKVNPITKIHGSYQFYFIDGDNNWWEIECRPNGLTNEQVFENGDFVRNKN